jgi:uncharacterized protein (DUF1499 family)
MTRFAACPDKPNCVSSRADPSDRQHYIEPITGTLADAKAWIESQPRTKIVEEDDGYLHATFKTRFFGFTDDVELQADGDTLHVRSASRVGYGDLGVNRKRVEALRDALS